MPRRNEFNLFDNFFDDPIFDRMDNKLMRTDIKEKDKSYIIDIDLPGFTKDNINIELENGYLKINAKSEVNNDEKEHGKYIKRERFYGECSRSFYVGDTVEFDDIKASFKNGILSIEVPKEDETKEIPKKKYIQIED